MYLDRHGVIHTPQSSDIIRPRHGAFAIMCQEDFILVTAGAHAPSVPELPGGGIDAGEDAEQAVIREIYEETGYVLDAYRISQVAKETFGFYADDKDEYWDYDVTYYRISSSQLAFFQGQRETPEGGLSWWMPTGYIEGHAFRHMDKVILKQLDYI